MADREFRLFHKQQDRVPCLRRTLALTTNVTLRLNEQIDDAIRRSPNLARHKVRFETHEGRVVMRGEVGTYYQKQMAQETLRRVPGVEHIENRLEVLWR
jgi:osmotically-inducible protein OsmY